MIVEHVLHLIKHDQRAPVAKKALRRAVGTESLRAIDGVAVPILAGDLEKLAADIGGKQARQFAFARAWPPVQEDVDTRSPRFDTVLEIGSEHCHGIGNVRIVFPGEL